MQSHRDPNCVSGIAFLEFVFFAVCWLCVFGVWCVLFVCVRFGCFVFCFLFFCRLPLSQAQARSRFIFFQLLLKLRFLVHPDSKLQVPLDRQM